MVNLVKAVLNVMKEVEGIDKNMKVGSGYGSYDGISDADVKEIIGSAMQRNGLVAFPIEIDANTTVSRWEEHSYRNNQVESTKQKQSIFTEVNTKYLLVHESGESQIIAGYGHGVDSQDKSAGKATTYALKNALLYTYLVPTRKIDDTDGTHSKDIPTPPPADKKEPVKPRIAFDKEENRNVFVSAIIKNYDKKEEYFKMQREKYTITDEEEKMLTDLADNILANQVSEPSEDEKVASMQKRESEEKTEPKKLLTDSIKKQIREAKSMVDVTAIFNNNKELQSNAAFLDLLKKKREDLNPKKQTA